MIFQAGNGLRPGDATAIRKVAELPEIGRAMWCLCNNRNDQLLMESNAMERFSTELSSRK